MYLELDVLSWPRVFCAVRKRARNFAVYCISGLNGSVSVCLCSWSSEALCSQSTCRTYKAIGLWGRKRLCCWGFVWLQLCFEMDGVTWIFGDLCLHGLLIEIRACVAFYQSRLLSDWTCPRKQRRKTLQLQFPGHFLSCSPRMFCSNLFRITPYLSC